MGQLHVWQAACQSQHIEGHRKCQPLLPNVPTDQIKQHGQLNIMGTLVGTLIFWDNIGWQRSINIKSDSSV
eukprot:UN3506